MEKMTEAEARKILINKSLTGAFTNGECDALSVLFREVEHLQGWKSEVIEQFCKYDGDTLEEVVQRAKSKAINEFAERMQQDYVFDSISRDDISFYGFCEYIKQVAEQIKAGV